MRTSAWECGGEDAAVVVVGRGGLREIRDILQEVLYRHGLSPLAIEAGNRETGNAGRTEPTPALAAASGLPRRGTPGMARAAAVVECHPLAAGAGLALVH